MILSIAWKNIWRNKVRSFILLFSIVLGLVSGVFSLAFSLGMVEKRIEDAILTEVSHIQIHDTNYLESKEIQDYLKNSNTIAKTVRKNNKVKAVSERIKIEAFASTAHNNSGVQLIGIDPENERLVTNLYSKLIEGTYFDDSYKKPILIGKKLSERLKVKVGSKIILDFQQENGTLTRDKYKVVGIYKTSNTMYDQMNVFVPKEKLLKATGLESNISHEIAIFLNTNDDLDNIQEQLQNQYKDLDVSSWGELSPELKMMNEGMNVSMYIIVLIILIALAAGIVNTMFMIILERVKEIGMLMAIGMSKAKLFFMIMLETLLISFVGGGLGIILGTLITKWVAIKGMDLSMWSEGLEAYGIGSIVYPSINGSTVFTIALMTVMISILAAIFPAIKALNLKPVEALKSE